LLQWHFSVAVAGVIIALTTQEAKGIRLSVRVYANSTGEAIEQVFNTYLKARTTAMDIKIPLAPVENR
jgi:ribosomal protein L19